MIPLSFQANIVDVGKDNVLRVTSFWVVFDPKNMNKYLMKREEVKDGGKAEKWDRYPSLGVLSHFFDKKMLAFLADLC